MLRPIPLDHALELFSPTTGTRLRIDGPATHALRQRAPRSVQFSLTNHCNLSCWFCSRPTERPSHWTVDTALALLADLDHLGVAEVAFGGGEPLVFKGIFDLVDALTTHTRLAVHLTTNGQLLTDDALTRLHGKVGEIRLSLYEDNDWRDTIRRLDRHGQRFGVNQLVTPTTLPELPSRLADLAELGCQDVLLLPAVGEPTLALTPAQTRQLAALLDTAPFPGIIKLGVCWGPELAHLPRLFPSSDCGAGRDFLEITSDGHARACSFHAEAIPFHTADDVVDLWRTRRDALRAHAGCEGCPRGRLRGVPATTPGLRLYNAFASNNSGSYTLLGAFRTVDEAEQIAVTLNQLTLDMADESRSNNPVQDLLRAAGIDAPDDIAGYDDWPDSDYGGPPEAVAVGTQVWWHSSYTISMPSELGHWFYAMGGRVVTEIDHAHHPLLAHITLWHDLPWKERRDIDLAPTLEALWMGPLSRDSLQARARTTDFNAIELLCLDPSPADMRALHDAAASLGLRTNMKLTEALTNDPDLDSLW